MCHASNYRAITLCPVIAKLFEHCIITKYQSNVHTNDLQFGLKGSLDVLMMFLL